MCWAAQMRVDPPDRLNTLPSGPWLSQTSAGGQRSGLAFLCPSPPWVPTYPLSRGSPSAVTHSARTCSFFLCLCSGLIISKSLSLLPSLSYSWSHCLTFSHSVILFLTYLFVSCLSFPFLRPSSLVNSWVDMPAGEVTPPFPGPSVFLYPSIPPSLSCALPWLWRDQFTRQQLRQASFVPGLPSEKAFFASGEFLTTHGDIERLIALLPNLAVLFYSGSLSCWTQCTLGLQG